MTTEPVDPVDLVDPVDPVESFEPPAPLPFDAAPEPVDAEPAAPIKPPRVWTVFVAFIGLGVMQISFSVPLAMAAMARINGDFKSAFASPPVLATAIWLS